MHAELAERRRTGGNERARRRHGLRELRLLDDLSRHRSEDCTTCGCGPNRARPRATIGGWTAGAGCGGGSLRSTSPRVVSRPNQVGVSSRSPLRIGLRRRMLERDDLLRPALEIRDHLRRLVGLGPDRRGRSTAPPPGPRMSVSPCSTRQLPRRCQTSYTPCCQCSASSAATRIGTLSSARGSVIASWAAADAKHAQRRDCKERRLGAHRERGVSTASIEARATCVSSRRSDWHPCQKC